MSERIPASPHYSWDSTPRAYQLDQWYADVIGQIHADRRERLTAAELLRDPDGRAACRKLAAAGKAYGADAEAYARRPVVRQAVALLRERLARREARAAQAPESGRYARLALERRLARTRAAVLAAADYRTARNGHDDRVRFGTAGASSDTGSDRSVYRGAFKGWAATTSSHSYTVPPDWLEAVAARGLAECDGLLTLDARPVPGHDAAELYAAVWVEQGRGTSLHAGRGYLARLRTPVDPAHPDASQDVHTYHAATAAAALAGVRRKAGLVPPRRAVDLDRLARRYGTVPVTADDAHACGLCAAGVRSWCHAVGLDPAGTATLAQVIAGYRLRPLPEALRVIRQAVKSHRQWEKLLAEPRGRVRFDAEGGFRIEE